MKSVQQVKRRYEYWTRSRGFSHDEALVAMAEEYIDEGLKRFHVSNGHIPKFEECRSEICERIRGS